MIQLHQVLYDTLQFPPSEGDSAMAARLDGFDLGAEWEEEIRRRVEDVDAGRMRTVSGDEVFLRIEQRLRAR